MKTKKIKQDLFIAPAIFIFIIEDGVRRNSHILFGGECHLDLTTYAALEIETGYKSKLSFVNETKELEGDEGRIQVNLKLGYATKKGILTVPESTKFFQHEDPDLFEKLKLSDEASFNEDLMSYPEILPIKVFSFEDFISGEK